MSKLEDNVPYTFKEHFKPKIRCQCGGEVMMRIVLTRNVEREHHFDSNPLIGGSSRGGVTEIISPTLEIATYCEACALRYDLDRIEEIRDDKIIQALRKKYAKEYGLKIKE